jgi:hypothetical protein
MIERKIRVLVLSHSEKEKLQSLFNSNNMLLILKNDKSEDAEN